MKLLIRADANTKMGIGHVMRMLALGQAWKERGGDVIFCFKECPRELQGKLVDEGFLLRRISCRKLGDINDAESLLQLSLDATCDWIVLDGYLFAYGYQEYLSQKATCRILLVDDYGFTNEVAVDRILNPNPGVESLDYVNLKDIEKVWCGADFCLLRKEFRNPASDKCASSQSFGVLISMGGADPGNVSLRLLEELSILDWDRLKYGFRLVVGAAYPYLGKLSEWLDNTSLEVEVLNGVEDMRVVYNWADAAIVAGGVTALECLASGLRIAVVCVGDNQVRSTDYFEQEGYATKIGSFSNGSLHLRKDKLVSWLSATGDNSEVSQGVLPIDAFGALRVVDKMLSF